MSNSPVTACDIFTPSTLDADSAIIQSLPGSAFIRMNALCNVDHKSSVAKLDIYHLSVSVLDRDEQTTQSPMETGLTAANLTLRES
jgi:hypothetical protein